MTEEAVIKIDLDETFRVHKKIGPGVLKRVYKTVPGLLHDKFVSTPASRKKE